MSAEQTQAAVLPLPSPSPKVSRVPWLLLMPLTAFGALAVLFAVSLQRVDPNRLPSMLIGKPAPAFTLPAVAGLTVARGAETSGVPGLSHTDLVRGKVSIVNVWASWCTPCIAEHPYLTELARTSGAPLYGINYKDKPENARRFLGSHGNPFQSIGADASGRTAIDWGVTGVPETFIVDGRGVIAYKHTGPITPDAIERDLLPAIHKAGAAARK